MGKNTEPPEIKQNNYHNTFLNSPTSDIFIFVSINQKVVPPETQYFISRVRPHSKVILNSIVIGVSQEL